MEFYVETGDLYVAAKIAGLTVEEFNELRIKARIPPSAEAHPYVGGQSARFFACEARPEGGQWSFGTSPVAYAVAPSARGDRAARGVRREITLGSRPRSGAPCRAKPFVQMEPSLSTLYFL